MNSNKLKKRIAIIIPVHNGLELTKTCLETLSENLKNTHTDLVVFSTIIIDDGSTDSTSHWILENHKDCVVLQGDGNLWWSGAVNVGVRYAVDTLNADYILLWNNDIQIQHDYFSLLSGLVLTVDTNTVIGSVVYSDPDTQNIWSAGGIFNPYTGAKYMIKQLPSGETNEQLFIKADWLTGMGTLVPKEVIEKTGYWDAKRFPQYYGDSDFIYRAKLKGFKILVCNQLKVINDLSNSGIKKVTHFREIIPTLTNIKSIHHIGKNFLFYRLYSKTPWAYLRFFQIYVEFFGGFIKRKISDLFSSKPIE